MLIDSNGTFRLVVTTAVAIVVLVTLTPGTVGAATTIGSCTTIDAGNAPGDGLVLLNQSITDSTASSCVNITVSNITFDGQGNTVDGDGSGGIGINVTNTSTTISNVTVKNVNISDWSLGVRYDDVNGGEITGVNATPVLATSISAFSSSGVDMRGNTVSSGVNGISANADSVVENNDVLSGTGRGIEVTGANTIVRKNNVSSVSQDGIVVFGDGVRVESNDITSPNQDGVVLRSISSDSTVVDNDITDYREVSRTIQTFMTDPEKIIDRIRDGTLDVESLAERESVDV